MLKRVRLAELAFQCCLAYIYEDLPLVQARAVPHANSPGPNHTDLAAEGSAPAGRERSTECKIDTV